MGSDIVECHACGANVSHLGDQTDCERIACLEAQNATLTRERDEALAKLAAMRSPEMRERLVERLTPMCPGLGNIPAMIAGEYADAGHARRDEMTVTEQADEMLYRSIGPAGHAAIRNNPEAKAVFDCAVLVVSGFLEAKHPVDGGVEQAIEKLIDTCLDAMRWHAPRIPAEEREQRINDAKARLVTAIYEAMHKAAEPVDGEVERVARAIAVSMDVDPDVFIGMHGLAKWAKTWHPNARAAIAAMARSDVPGEG